MPVFPVGGRLWWGGCLVFGLASCDPLNFCPACSALFTLVLGSSWEVHSGMKSKRKFARAKDWSSKKLGTVDVTNRPDYVGEMLNSDKVASVEVKHQGGRQDAFVKVKGVRATTGTGTLQAGNKDID